MSDDLPARIREGVSLVEVAEASGVQWDMRRSHVGRGEFWACCPFHQERTPSFHVVERGGAGGFFKCFGCAAKGSVIDFVMARDGCDAGEAIRRLAEDGGIEADPAGIAARRAAAAEARAKAEARDRSEGAQRREGALWMWRKAKRRSALLEAYLRARGVDLAAIGGVPASLRLAPSINCWLEGQNKRKERPAHSGPAMLGVIGRSGDFRGVHRTWITAEGRARLPDGAKVPKKMIGLTGGIHGQPVRLAPLAATLIVGEGIETTLAAYAWARRRGVTGIGAEAALSRGALAEGAWAPPPRVSKVVLMAEGSARDPRGAREATERAAEAIRARGIACDVRLPGGRWDRDVDAADVCAGLMAEGVA